MRPLPSSPRKLETGERPARFSGLARHACQHTSAKATVGGAESGGSEAEGGWAKIGKLRLYHSALPCGGRA